MKVTAVTPLAVTFPYERDPMSYCFVRIDTDEGITGYGESCDSYGCSYASVISAVLRDVYAPLLVGQEVGSAELAAERLRLATRRRLGDQWVAPQARSAIEIALEDIVARSEDRSITSLHGRCRDRVEVYASAAFLEEGDAGWHLRELEPLLEHGVTKVKLRVGPDWRHDVDLLAQIKARLGDGIELMVDGSETFSLATAATIAARLADLGVGWFEEPLPQGARAGIEELCAASPVPIAYGEHLFGRDDVLDALRRHQLSVYQPDAATCGGIAEARTTSAIAVSFGARVVPHICAGPIALAANLQLAASVPAIRLVEYPFGQAAGWRELGIGPDLGPGALVDGCLPVPDGPGLGVALDEAAAAARPYRAPGTRIAGSRAGLPDRFVGDR